LNVDFASFNSPGAAQSSASNAFYDSNVIGQAGEFEICGMLILILPPSVKPVEVWDSTLLRFYDVAKNDRVKKEVVGGATPCFCRNFVWSSNPDSNPCLSLATRKLRDYSSADTC
jgi:hypothetical protein